VLPAAIASAEWARCKPCWASARRTLRRKVDDEEEANDRTAFAGLLETTTRTVAGVTSLEVGPCVIVFAAVTLTMLVGSRRVPDPEDPCWLVVGVPVRILYLSRKGIGLRSGGNRPNCAVRGMNVSCAGNGQSHSRSLLPHLQRTAIVALYGVPTIATGNSTVMMDSDAAAVVFARIGASGHGNGLHRRRGSVPVTRDRTLAASLFLLLPERENGRVGGIAAVVRAADTRRRRKHRIGELEIGIFCTSTSSCRHSRSAWDTFYAQPGCTWNKKVGQLFHLGNRPGNIARPSCWRTPSCVRRGGIAPVRNFVSEIGNRAAVIQVRDVRLVMSGFVISGLVMSGFVMSGLVISGLVTTMLVMSDRYVWIGDIGFVMSGFRDIGLVISGLVMSGCDRRVIDLGIGDVGVLWCKD